MDKKRIAYIDKAKGVAILLVILGHCCGSVEEPINRFVLSFHMPLFFFLSGLLAKPLLGGVSGLMGGVKKRIKSLLIPQATLLAIQTVYKCVLQIINGIPLTNLSFDFLFKFWFLPVLFLASVIYMIISIVVTRHRNMVSLSLSVLCILGLQTTFPTPDNIILQQICIVPYAMLFYTLGNIIFPFISSFSQYFNKTYIGMPACIAFSFVYILSQINTPVKMYANEYGDFALFLPCVLGAILLVVIFSMKLNATPLLDTIGRYSVAIYVWQFLTCDFARNLGGRIMQDYGSDCKIAFAFSVSVMLSYVIVLITVKYIPQIYSIKKN